MGSLTQIVLIARGHAMRTGTAAVSHPTDRHASARHPTGHDRRRSAANRCRSVSPPQHYDHAFACRAEGLWFEVHPENYLVDGGSRLAWLSAIRALHPVSLYGVSLSLAGDAAPDTLHLERLAALARRIEPAL